VLLPNGTAGTAYNQTVTATGDTPITWSLESGTLPTDLSLADTGIISGIPATAGTSTFTVKATNAAGSSTKPLSITITPVGVGGSKGWIVVDSPFTGILAGVSKIVFGNDKFVAVSSFFSDSKISTSPDGINWTAGIDCPFDGTNGIEEIAYGNGIFVITEGTYYKPRIAHSSDGVTWTVTANPLDTNGYISTIAYGNGNFVAVIGSNKMAYSSDGATWTAVTDAAKIFSLIVQGSTISTGIISGIAWGNGNFIARGDDGYLPKKTVKIATSPDGINWTTETPVISFLANFNGPIIYGDDKFVSWGEHGILAYSADGITWTDVSILDNPFYDGTSSGTINAIAFGNNKFVAVGNGGKIMYSSDGVTWTAETGSPFTYYINTIAYGKGKFVAGSNPSVIAYLSDN